MTGIFYVVEGADVNLVGQNSSIDGRAHDRAYVPGAMETMQMLAVSK